MKTEVDAEYQPFPEKAGRNTRQQDVEVPLFVRLLGLPRRRRILEVGCGAGIALPGLHRLCSPTLLVGLDVDGDALADAATRTHTLAPTAELVRGDVRAMPFADESFDVVVDFGTCYHIARSEQGLREIERVLTTGGTFATETRLNQFFSHPIRSRGRRLRLEAARRLRIERHCGLWMSFSRL
jgi:ubiquinone/menaquinone biosynthesis C-methylase UbiE